jgi:hypothetical protein
MKNIHVLPTDKSSIFFITNKGEYYLTEFFVPDTMQTFKNHNIYITSDERITEDNWFLDTISNTIHQAKQAIGVFNTRKKIILTTDLDLITHGVQQIDIEFLEWFVKNPGCETVEIDRDEREVGNHLGGVVIEYGDYKIIIPQEEPKSYIEYTNTDDFTSMIHNPQEKLKQSVQEYEQQGLEKYSHELETETRAMEAVEFLIDWMSKNQYFIGNDLLKAVKEAKEMEKEQKIEFAKIHVEAALKAAVDNIEMYDFNENGEFGRYIDEKSILNSYPLEKIK